MFKKIALVVATIVSLAAVRAARADEATLRDIQQTLGQVPTFFKTYPSEQLAAAWSDFKNLQLNPSTAIPGRYKELIGLAVAAQIPCRYCVYFHGEAAKLNGAADRELREAVALAAGTRKWSTVLNGLQVDMAEFRAGLMKAFEHASKAKPSTAPVTDAASARKDIMRVFGAVPPFLAAYPEAALAGAWMEMRTAQFGQTAIPGKYKELIGLAVASQIPCSFCVVAHTEGARANGATDAELHEAVAMAALTRQWSTWLNGTMQDEATFKKETDQIIGRAKKQMSAARAK